MFFDRIRLRRLASVALLLAAVAPPAAAQRLADLPRGTELRVRTVDTLRWRDGTLVSVAWDSLTMTDGTRPLAIARDQLREVEIRDRDASRVTRTLVGGVLGIVVGTVATAVTTSTCGVGPSGCEMAGYAIVPGSFLLGLIVGAASPVERWRAVELP